jgi:hypothetical protein
VLHCRREESRSVAFEMLAVAKSEDRLDDLGQYRPALDQFSLPQVLAVEVQQIEA